MASPHDSDPTPLARLTPSPPASHTHAAPVTGMLPKASIAYPCVYRFTATNSHVLTTAVKTPRYVSCPSGNPPIIWYAVSEGEEEGNSSETAQIDARVAVVAVCATAILAFEAKPSPATSTSERTIPHVKRIPAANPQGSKSSTVPGSNCRNSNPPRAIVTWVAVGISSAAKKPPPSPSTRSSLSDSCCCWLVPRGEPSPMARETIVSTGPNARASKNDSGATLPSWCHWQYVAANTTKPNSAPQRHTRGVSMYTMLPSLSTSSGRGRNMVGMKNAAATRDRTNVCQPGVSCQAAEACGSKITGTAEP
mmetsp:Transcript_33333/g.81930  ORF Transcript_33333/g.81930 Transcript_33333/m.81930 type:complete len:308 (-) Transcript_33333:224-1147(-)